MKKKVYNWKKILEGTIISLCVGGVRAFSDGQVKRANTRQGSLNEKLKKHSSEYFDDLVMTSSQSEVHFRTFLFI